MAKKKIEIVFDESTGKFVVHFEGFLTHEEEHQELDKLLAKLKQKGFDAEVTHRQDKPKLPRTDGDKLPGRDRIGGGS